VTNPVSLSSIYLQVGYPSPCVVMGEESSPTAANEDCKRWLKWVPSAWGYSWATHPQGL